MTYDISIRSDKLAREEWKPWQLASAELGLQLQDALEYLQGFRRNNRLPVNLAWLKLSMRFAGEANAAISDGRLEDCQQHYSAAIHYLDKHNNAMIAASESIRAEGDSANKLPIIVKVEVPLTVNPVIDSGPMVITRDRDGLISGLEPAK